MIYNIKGCHHQRHPFTYIGTILYGTIGGRSAENLLFISVFRVGEEFDSHHPLLKTLDFSRVFNFMLHFMLHPLQKSASILFSILFIKQKSPGIIFFIIKNLFKVIYRFAR